VDNRVGDLDRLARSFRLYLAAENKAPKTIETYGEAVAQLVQHLNATGITDARRANADRYGYEFSDSLARDVDVNSGRCIARSRRAVGCDVGGDS
jgi:hypothetical protein